MLSETLKELRAQKKITQSDMANLLNIKRQTYSAYERGVSFPDIVSLTKIADFFDVTTDYLLGYKKDTSSKMVHSDKTQSLLESYSDLSEEELKKVIEYIEFLKTKRKD
ncbi:MAG: helix-turn-helix transcriptional regulator [Clostridia bacterium]|nr:helix-turn-helix transcriptional regulator [Clostridia bacterium]